MCRLCRQVSPWPPASMRRGLAAQCQTLQQGLQQRPSGRRLALLSGPSRAVDQALTPGCCSSATAPAAQEVAPQAPPAQAAQPRAKRVAYRVLRPETLKQRMLECWEAEAVDYDEAGDFTVELAERLVRQADLQPNQSVLDVACGTGNLTLLAAEAVGRTGHVTAIDLSPSMLAKAGRARAAAAHPALHSCCRTSLLLCVRLSATERCSLAHLCATRHTCRVGCSGWSHEAHDLDAHWCSVCSADAFGCLSPGTVSRKLQQARPSLQVPGAAASTPLSSV